MIGVETYAPLPSGAVAALAADLHSSTFWEAAAGLIAAKGPLQGRIKVFPWPRTGEPLKSARRKASCEIGALRGWAAHYGVDSSVGVRTGGSSGLVILTADSPSALAQAEERHGPLPPGSVQSRSRSGKLRVWCSLPDGVALDTVNHFAPGVRLLADGGVCRLGRWTQAPDAFGIEPLPPGWITAAKALAEPPTPNVRRFV